MTRSFNKLYSLVAALMVVAMVGIGCAEQQRTSSPRSAPQPAPQQQERTVVRDANTVYWPTGDRATSVAAISQDIPREVAVGQQFPYTIKVTNITSNLVLNDVTVRNSGEGLQVAQSQPAASGGAQWDLGTLQPGQSKTIQITGSAAQPGQITRCTTIDYTPTACVVANVVEPALNLAAEAPSVKLVCEEIPLSVTVTNSGTGPAKNVRITSTLPEGVTTRRDNSNVDINVGTLAQGESKTYTIPVRASQTGNVQASFEASGEGELSGSAQTTTSITAPQLAVTADAPEFEYTTKTLTHTYTVTNNGNAVARDAKLVVDVSGATAAAQRTYNLGNIEPEGSKTVTVETTPNAMGEVQTSARATAYCADAQTAQASSEIRGTVGVLIEVVDQNDPVRVGGEEIYTIIVTNQGVADQTGVEITATLGPNMSFVSAGGATEATSQGKTVTFAPLATLGGKQVAKWTVRVKADSAADARFRIEMTTDQIGEPPVMETESTHFYE